MVMLRSLLVLSLSALPLLAQQTIPPEQLEFFESKIRPVLAKNCYACHSAEAKTRMGGLSLDTKNGLLAGGGRGEAVVPGDVDESRIVQAIRYDSKLKMPPMGQLPESVVADFEQWVAMGAPDPRESKVQVAESTINLEQGRKYWAFQTPRRTAPPAVENLSWPRGAIDQFILSKIEVKGLAPVADADKAALLRRATIDLIGMAPSAPEIEAFLADDSPAAFRKVIDRLLDSNHFGERWGRHWLDLARYGETVGRTRNAPYPLAWRYRDYVIDSFNKDKPYDRFIAEQIAGDLLPYQDLEQRREQQVATGFLAMGAHDLNEPDAKQFSADVADEMINVTTRTFMGLTVGCARCHDHKFDPIPQADYYAMAGVFNSTDLRAGVRRRPRFNAVFFLKEKLVTLDGIPAYHDNAEMGARLDELFEQAVQAEEDRNRDLTRKLAREMSGLPMPENLAMGVAEAGKVVNTPLNIGGDPHELGPEVERGFVQVLYSPEADLPKIPKEASGRLQLAQWLTRKDNPLTSRVFVNRAWHHLFGRGFVRTVDNFGAMGSQPTHPELLDYLALQFIDQGWSVKALIRQIMLSRTYQLSTEFNEANYDSEPDNTLLWRMSRRRMEVEALRDSILRISGELSRERPEAPAKHWDRNKLIRPGDKQIQPWEATETYRSVYVPIVRNNVNRFYRNFDFPDPAETHGARDVTTVAPQALFLMNSAFVASHASVAAERLLAKSVSNEERVRQAFRQTLSRDPNPTELERALEYVEATEQNFASEARPAAPQAEKPKRPNFRRALREVFNREPTEEDLARAQAWADGKRPAQILRQISANKEAMSGFLRDMLEREPSAYEIDRVLSYLEQGQESQSAVGTGNPTQEAWGRLYQSLFGSAEFRYRG